MITPEQRDKIMNKVVRLEGQARDFSPETMVIPTFAVDEILALNEPEDEPFWKPHPTVEKIFNCECADCVEARTQITLRKIEEYERSVKVADSIQLWALKKWLQQEDK